MAGHFETLRNNEEKLVCEFDYESLTVATAFKGPTRYAQLDPDKLFAGLLKRREQAQQIGQAKTNC